ncbi:MAG: hypothetical protein GW941_02825, partial [Candidatus Pacebacteria bacterium]|nr:hypothetical protein [Candidatus Paceibacterota bacterium]
MLKHIKKNIKKIHSIFTILLMLFQNIAPLFFLAAPAYAAEAPVVSDVSLAFDSGENELTLKGSVNTDTEYLFRYDDNDEETPSEAITGSVNGVNFEENIFIGTCSGDDCVEDEVTNGSLEFTATDYKADYQITDGVLWLTRNNISSVAQVELNKKYLAPQNNQVSVTFTSLPENPGSLNIEEITLTDEQVESLGAVSNVAYDITSSMQDGSFEYDLTLPLPEGADETAKVVYADNVEGLADAKELNKTVSGNEIKAEKVDHFTVFVVTTNPGADCIGGVYAVGVCYASLQDAVDGSANGDTIDILSDISLGHRVDVNKEITIDGHNNIVTPTFTKTSNSNNSSLVIFSDNTTVKNLIIDGVSGTSLHGIQAYKASNVLFDNLTVKNNDSSGITVNGSIVTVNNVTTSGNGWGGINVDQGSGVTTEAKLIVTGTSSHDEATHIWLDDITKNVSVDDTVGQYTYTDVGNTRVYTFDDSSNPVIANIKMFVNGIESTFMRAGDTVRVEADITDIGSGIDKVRLLAKNAAGPGYVDSGYFIHDSGDKYVREFTFPADGKYIDLHTPITDVVEGLSFYIKAYDLVGNYTNSSSTRFTFDTGIPSMSEIKMYVSEDGLTYTEKSFVKPGDYVRVEVVANDSESGIKDVEFRITSKSNAYVAPRSYVASPISGNRYRFEYQVPLDGKYINTHGLMSEVLNDHTFWARATDKVGNYNHGISGEFTYDITGPLAPEIILPAEDQYFNSQPILGDWTDATDPSGIQKYRIQYEYDDGHTFSGYPYRETTASQRNHTPGISEQGGVSYRVQAFDNAGNEGAWSEWRHYFYDATAPVKPVLTSPSNDALVTGNPTQNWEAIDDAKYYEYESYSDESLTNKVYETTVNGNSRTVGGNQTISFWWRVRAVDAAGNKSEWSDAWKLNIDNTAPTVPVNPSHNNVIIPTNNFDFDWDDSIDTSTITYEFQSSLNSAQTDGVLTTDLWHSGVLPTSMIHSSGAPDGTWYWQVRAIDAVGNTSEWSEIWNVTLDQVAPVTTLTSPADEFTSNGGIQIQGSSTDSNKVSEVNLYYSEADQDNWQLITKLTNSGNDEPFSFDHTWTPSEEGIYDIKAAGTDTAGNVEHSAYAYGIVYDVSAPVIPTWGTVYKGHGVVAENEISCGGYTNDPQVTFEWNKNSEEDIKGYWFGTKTNSKHQWFDATSNVKTANMTPGNNPYYYTIIAVDNADNESPISEQCGLTLDQDAPNVEITNPASGLVTGIVDIRGTV